MIAQVYLKNEGDETISTNPYSWGLTADGLKYTHDVATYDQSINTPSVEVGKGGEK